MKTFTDVERMSDHCENLAEYFYNHHNSREQIAIDEQKEILAMLETIKEMIHYTNIMFENNILENKDKVYALEAKLDEQYRLAREDEVKRFQENNAKEEAYFCAIFIDVAANIERIGDHCTNIIENIETAFQK